MNRIKRGISLYTVALVVDTNALADADLAGAMVTVPDFFKYGGGGSLIVGATLCDNSNQKKDVDVILANAPLSNSTLTMNSAFAPHADDLSKIQGVLRFRDYDPFAANAVSMLDKASHFMPIPVDAGISNGVSLTSLYLAVVPREAVDYVAATDLILNLFVRHGM